MPECFDISFITGKTCMSRTEMDTCLGKFGLTEGRNKTKLFGGKQIVISFIEDKETDFEEISIGISEHHFHRESFDDELKGITNFINHFFECNTSLKYALCSYELNGYLLRGVKSLNEFNNDLLRKFPIIYARKEPFEPPSLQINLESQEIFE